MNEITENIERLLWFIYRVLFTLFPSVLLLFAAGLFINFSRPEAFASFKETITNFGFERWCVILALVFSTNLLLESTTKLVFRVLGFRPICRNHHSTDQVLIELLDKYNPEILGIMKKNGNAVCLEDPLFNFGLIQGNERSNWFNNYVWFLISREFMFSNLAIVIIICNVCFIPYFLFKYYDLNYGWFVGIQSAKFILLLWMLFLAHGLLKRNYPGFGENKKEYPEDGENSGSSFKFLLAPITFLKGSGSHLKFLLVPFIFLLLALVFCGFPEWEFSGFIFLTEAIVFIICPLLFLRALREYIHVGYLVMTCFAKDRYDIQVAEKRSKD